MPELQDIRLETFARAYIDCGFNGSEAVRTMYPDIRPGTPTTNKAYELRHCEGVEARIAELRKQWQTDTIDRIGHRLAKIIQLPTTQEQEGVIDAQHLAKVADVGAKYLGVANRMANADGSNIVGPVIMELPAQILDGSGGSGASDAVQDASQGHLEGPQAPESGPGA